ARTAGASARAAVGAADRCPLGDAADLPHSYVAPVVRRAASISALATIDAVGVTAGLFASLVLREVYYGRNLDWSYLWQAETDWLPFLILVTLLVFAQGDLYAEREHRPGMGRVVSSLLLVVLFALAFGL